MHEERHFSQIDILNISNQNNKSFSRSNINTHNRVEIRNRCLFNKFVHKKILHKHYFRMSKNVKNVKQTITIAINIIVVVMLKRYFVAKSCFDLTFSFDLSRTKFFISFVDCIHIVFVRKMIDCCFIKRKKHCRKMLKACFRILNIRMQKRQKNNFFFAFS